MRCRHGQVTNGLLEAAMTESGKDRFLIDGFPRNEENRAAFEADTGEVTPSTQRFAAFKHNLCVPRAG